MISPSKLTSLREHLALSQAELAEYLGVTRVTIWNYEQGRSPIPKHIILATYYLIRERIEETVKQINKGEEMKEGRVEKAALLIGDEQEFELIRKLDGETIPGELPAPLSEIREQAADIQKTTFLSCLWKYRQFMHDFGNEVERTELGMAIRLGVSLASFQRWLSAEECVSSVGKMAEIFWKITTTCEKVLSRNEDIGREAKRRLEEAEERLKMLEEGGEEEENFNVDK